MKVLIGGLLLVACFGASSADAWPWSHKGQRKDRLPRPIDSPIPRPKADDSHKHGDKRAHHPRQFLQNGWGSEVPRLTHGRQQIRRVPYLYQE